MCERCGDPLAPGSRVYCPKHLDDARDRRLRSERRRLGVKPKRPGGSGPPLKPRWSREDTKPIETSPTPAGARGKQNCNQSSGEDRATKLAKDRTELARRVEAALAGGKRLSFTGLKHHVSAAGRALPMFRDVIQNMSRLGILRFGVRGHQTIYWLRTADEIARMPEVRTIAPGTVDGAQLRRAVTELLADGASRAAENVIAEIRPSLPAATPDQIRATLATLAAAGAVLRFQLGASERFQAA